jgi:hypothetical protein
MAIVSIHTSIISSWLKMDRPGIRVSFIFTVQHMSDQNRRSTCFLIAALTIFSSGSRTFPITL